MPNTINRPFLRVIPELRNSHSEQSRRFASSQIIFVNVKPDLEPAALPGHPRQVSIRGAVALAVRGKWDIVEIPEPFFLRALPLTIAVGLATRVGDIVHRRRTIIVTYAIENNDADILFRGMPRMVRRALLLVLRTIFTYVLDRIAFGSPGAQSSYLAAQILGSRCAVALMNELPQACHLEPLLAKEHLAAFVGVLEPRKGLDRLLSAWTQTEATKNGWHLVIAGQGSLQPAVEAMALREPSVSYLGAIGRADLHDYLSRSCLVILPSSKEGRWREQIGLSIVEGLAHGCHIVTSSDTGLAPWLALHGHSVVPAARSLNQLVEALNLAMAHPLDPACTLSTLPKLQGRWQAEDWMYGDTSHSIVPDFDAS